MRNLDHFVIAVEDLASSQHVYQRLGFSVMPKARHAAIGTANHIIQLHDTYLELLGDLDQCVFEPLKQRFASRRAAGDGFYINCLTSSALQLDREHLLARGHACGEIISARRHVTMPDGQTDETASDCFYVWRDEPRLTSTLFYCLHSKPHVIWFEPWQSHPNTAQTTLSLTYASDSLNADEPYFSDLFGAPPAERGADCIAYRTPRGERFEVFTHDGLAARFGCHTPARNGLAALGVGIRYGVASLDVCRAALLGTGVPFTESTGVITVAAADACGVVSEFEQLPRKRL
jgi:hypothetical protein